MPPHSALTEWLEALTGALAQGQLIKATLNQPLPATTPLKSIDIRPILIKRVLKLSFTYHERTRDVVKNHTPEEALPLLATALKTQFEAARLCTTDADVHLRKKGTSYTLTRQPPTHTAAPCLCHDKPKQHVLKANGKAYLHALGLTDAEGAVLKTAQDKFRQINKYIETLDALLRPLPAHKPLRIVDMGSGKGYLTFALYDHLTHTLKREAEVVGVEFRPELVRLCNTIATDAGFKHLHFTQGSIADYDCTGADVVIALHACDTATDDALFKAITAKARLIVVAPCCHKQIRRQMGTHAAEPLGFLLRFGTYTERMAEMITDGLRAQILELYGYSTNLFEFISEAHTPKNVMIVATKTSKAPNTQALKTSIAAAKAQFGIKQHYLEKLLGLE